MSYCILFMINSTAVLDYVKNNIKYKLLLFHLNLRRV